MGLKNSCRPSQTMASRCSSIAAVISSVTRAKPEPADSTAGYLHHDEYCSPDLLRRHGFQLRDAAAGRFGTVQAVVASPGGFRDLPAPHLFPTSYTRIQEHRRGHCALSGGRCKLCRRRDARLVHKVAPTFPGRPSGRGFVVVIMPSTRMPGARSRNQPFQFYSAPENAQRGVTR